MAYDFPERKRKREAELNDIVQARLQERNDMLNNRDMHAEDFPHISF